MPPVDLKKLFDSPTSQIKRLGELVGPGDMFAGDPLTSDTISVELGQGQFDIEAAVTPEGFAVVRAMILGRTPTRHRLLGNVVVDTGTFGFSLRNPATLGEDERESLLSDHPVRLGHPTWLVSFRAGMGDGVYPVFASEEGEELVGVWVDFGLVVVAERAKLLDKKLSEKAFLALFDAFETSARSGTPFPDYAPLRALRRRKVHAQLLPRLAKLLDAPKVSSFTLDLARRWLELDGFQQALVDANLSNEAWHALTFEHGLFQGRTLDDNVAVAIAANEQIDLAVRLVLGDAAMMWPIAASRVREDPHALAFFLRWDVPGCAPSPEMRAAVERVLRDRGLAAHLGNLRKYDPPRLP